jgi:catechol 2,3-dioxygenase-like lactoylglutathione lyase family enzyme
MSTDTQSIVTGVDFIVVATKDIEAAEEFYATVLGLPVGMRYGQSPGVEFETGNLTIAVMQSEAFGMEYSTNGNPIALQVADMDTARAALESRGVEFSPQVVDSGACRMAFFRDPDGNQLMLHHRYKPRERD